MNTMARFVFESIDEMTELFIASWDEGYLAAVGDILTVFKGESDETRAILEKHAASLAGTILKMHEDDASVIAMRHKVE